MESKPTHAFKGLRAAALFIAIAFVLQLVFVILLTPQGLSHIYPYLVRAKSEEITHDASFAEYYDLRTAFADGELFFLGSDTNVAQSYYVILDYLRFLKKSFDINYLALDVTITYANTINEYISADDATLAEAEEKLMKTNKTAEFREFIKDLRDFNNTLTPQRKLTVIGIDTIDIYEEILDPFRDNLVYNWVNVDTTITTAVQKSDPDEFFDYFDANAEAFESYLGKNEYNRFIKARDLYRTGNYDNQKLAEKIAAIPEGKALCVVPNERLDTDSGFFDCLKDERVAYSVQTKYHNSQKGPSQSRITDVNDIDLPFSSETAVRFVTEQDTASFRNFYRRISNPTGRDDKADLAAYFDEFATPYYFIVSNSPAALY